LLATKNFSLGYLLSLEFLFHDFRKLPVFFSRSCEIPVNFSEKAAIF